jgi:hypothetical protein
VPPFPKARLREGRLCAAPPCRSRRRMVLMCQMTLGRARVPDGILLVRHRELRGQRHEAWIRRALLVLVGAVLFLSGPAHRA